MTDSAILLQAVPRRRAINGELLDIASASQLLGCSQKTLRARVSRRIVPFRKFAGRIVFRRVELEQFIDGLPGVTVAQAQANLAARSK
jgi:Helix-turn-helix domain